MKLQPKKHLHFLTEEADSGSKAVTEEADVGSRMRMKTPSLSLEHGHDINVGTTT